MSEEQLAFKQYLAPPMWTFYMAAVIAVLVSALALSLGKIQGASLILVAVAFLFAYLAIKDNLKALRRVQEYEQTGKLAEALPDFNAGAAMLDGELHIGQQNLYGKRMGVILPYQDIARMYQYVHKTNFVEDRRALIALTRAGERVTVCKLKTRGKDDSELALVLSLAKAKNPDIQFGYAGR